MAKWAGVIGFVTDYKYYSVEDILDVAKIYLSTICIYPVENLSTFLNTFSLKVLPSLAATLADNSIIEIADIILINATLSICNPWNNI